MIKNISASSYYSEKEAAAAAERLDSERAAEVTACEAALDAINIPLTPVEERSRKNSSIVEKVESLFRSNAPVTVPVAMANEKEDDFADSLLKEVRKLEEIQEEALSLKEEQEKEEQKEINSERLKIVKDSNIIKKVKLKKKGKKFFSKLFGR
jgi:uncharacterized surface anchored protein